jgi:succinate-semialdehyde dehydrogenase/glutarate-semialdehyde dehydrogenase
VPIASINPATGETLRSFAPLDPAGLEERLARAGHIFDRYRRTPFADRSEWMTQAAEVLEADTAHFARLMTLEMGKPIRAARDEVAKCAWVCRYYAEGAERFLADEDVLTGAAKSYVTYQPLGPLLAVMPWNFPFWQVFRFAAPALMAGNVALLKHASNVPQCALAIEEVFARAGFPDGAFQTLLVGSDAVPALLDDPRVAAATLTGSDAAGSSVASVAGRRI